MREAAHDYRMDARLVAECGDEVGSFRESLYNLPRYILRAPSVAVVEEMELDLRQMLSKRHSPLSYFSVFCVAKEIGPQSVIVFTDVMLKTLAELLCFLNSILTILLRRRPEAIPTNKGSILASSSLLVRLCSYSAYDTKFFIILFERAFKMMKNGAEECLP